MVYLSTMQCIISCISSRFAVNGVSIYNAVDATESDAYQIEGDTMDACGAHADLFKRYILFPQPRHSAVYVYNVYMADH